VDERSNFQHPTGGWHAEGNSVRFTDGAHEIAVDQRVRRTNVDASLNRRLPDEEFNGADQIRVVDPRNELRSRAGGPSETQTNQILTVYGTRRHGWGHQDGGAQRDAAYLRRGRIEERLLPRLHNFHTESPCRWMISPDVADFSCSLIHWTIQSVAVDGCSAGIHPNCRRAFGLSDGAPNGTSRPYARIQNLPPVGFRIAAIDAASGEIDHHIGAIYFLHPRAVVAPIPHHCAPWRGLGMTRDYRDMVPAVVKVRREYGAYLASAAGDDDFHFVFSLGYGLDQIDHHAP
jgi:hypothetical protein